MGTRKNIQIEKCCLIIILHKLDESNREISRWLQIPHRTVDYNVKNASTSGLTKKCTGRPRKTIILEDFNIYLLNLSANATDT